MFKCIAEGLVLLLIKHKKLDKEDEEIYTYGLEVILLNGLLMISFLIMSICFNIVFHFFGFLLFFTPLRMFIGGYHAKHAETCFLFSNLTYIMSIIIVKNYIDLYHNINLVIITLLALFIMYVFSPVKNPNKPLAEYQYKRNKKIAFYIVLIELVLFIIFLKLDLKIASSIIVFVIMNCIVFLTGKINYIIKDSNIRMLKCKNNGNI